MRKSLFFQKLHDKGPVLGETDVIQLEREIGVALPEDYRKFLLEYNGGQFYEFLLVPLPTQEYDCSWGISRLYRLLDSSDKDPRDLGLRQVFRMYQSRIPANTLPIGDDSSDLLLLDLGSSAFGTLWLWVRDFEPSREREMNRVPVADSFSDLADKCRLWTTQMPSETEEPFIAIEIFDLDRLRRCLDAGCDPNARNELETPLLVFAAQERNYDAAQLLLSRGAAPDLPELRNGQTALGWVHMWQAEDFERLLRKHGATQTR